MIIINILYGDISDQVKKGDILNRYMLLCVLFLAAKWIINLKNVADTDCYNKKGFYQSTPLSNT